MDVVGKTGNKLALVFRARKLNDWVCFGKGLMLLTAYSAHRHRRDDEALK